MISEIYDYIEAGFKVLACMAQAVGVQLWRC